jgi:hypothetical protein
VVPIDTPTVVLFYAIFRLSCISLVYSLIAEEERVLLDTFRSESM